MFRTVIYNISNLLHTFNFLYFRVRGFGHVLNFLLPNAKNATSAESALFEFMLLRQNFTKFKPVNRYLASFTNFNKTSLPMPPRPKKKPSTPGEEYLLLPTPPSNLTIVDTHTHVAPTFEFYRRRYKQGKHQTVYDFVRAMYEGRNVESIVDVWCDAPVDKLWKEFADSSLNPEDGKRLWGLEYWFVMGPYRF